MSTDDRSTEVLDVTAMITDPGTEIIICCGSGGVGKTTMSAALAVRAAELGRRTVVLTIDPARRLAQSLGITDLDNTPQRVTGIDESRGGSLDAMMLDMKRTFDDVVLAHASGDKAQQILENPFYEALSTSFSGTQEYMAMEKLGQLHREAVADGRWDLIVVDTPPARSALDFLDAPEHLSRLLDGRFLKLLLAPTRGPLRLMSAGFSVVLSTMNKVLGSQVLTDVQTFASAFEALFGGFRQRAEQTLTHLQGEHTTFLVVSTAERESLREASYFVDRLTEERMPLAGMIVNRVHSSTVTLSAQRALAMAEELPAESPEAVALTEHAQIAAARDREQAVLERFSASQRAPHRQPIALAQIPHLVSDVYDLTALRRVGGLLAGEGETPGTDVGPAAQE
ncbi:ArsA family ATPase [Propionibacteriaceae bacterium Y1700]|uniref:ArsA family ATPase n=1 Tax=Microlunatus sp. Y1700 TaxID=3418487 RepID=UPI003DA72BA4